MANAEERGRERILARIAAALALPAAGAEGQVTQAQIQRLGQVAKAGDHKGRPYEPASPSRGTAGAEEPADSGAEIFPPIDDPLARFCAECQANGTECLVLADWQACGSALGDVLGELPPGEIFAQDAPAIRRAVAPAAGNRPIRWSSEGAAAESSSATVTLAEALVAETGSVLISTACGGRGGSVVAPVHVVLARSVQLVGSLEEGLAAVRANGALFSSSALFLITGPSRTADIEKILVRGAHGPRRLIVLLSQEEE